MLIKESIDLHIHSTFSDGKLTPYEIVKLAKSLGITVIALTDHDSTDGINEAMEYAEKFGVTVIPGVELSVAYKNYKDIHLLGYYIDPSDVVLHNKLKSLQKARKDRAIKIIDRINEKLIDNNYNPLDRDEIFNSTDGAIGRPHIAHALVKRNYAASMQDAFLKYLEPCNIPKKYFPFQEAVSEIKRVGGIPVLAHPQSISRDKAVITTIIMDMVKQGIEGIEAINPMGTADEELFLRKLANNLGIIVTGGSDFHGEPGTTLGQGYGNLRIEYDLFTNLLKVKEQCGV
ncbi:MAG: PHP domain-containing protein [Desulfuromonadales bacterium]|nr:PHP domain-containing protein [Desulfuromonadales bacterium]